MILQLLSHFKTYPSQYCSISLSSKHNQKVKSSLSFYYADKALTIFTLGWLGFALYTYLKIYNRPEELFAPMQYFGILFMPSFPPPFLYISVTLGAFLLTLSVLLYKDSILIRITLTLFLLWINTLPWSYGFLCHVAHVFLLSHLFRIFIPVKNIFNNIGSKEINQSVEWMYFGILITYTYSGIWKWIGLTYKLTMKPNEVSWLSPMGPLYTAFIEFHEYDLPFKHQWIFDYPLFWQTSFLAMSFILTFSFIAAFRQPIRVWTGLALIVFHAVNSLAFNINFYVAPMVLAVLFFPYELFMAKIKNHLLLIKEFTFEGNRFDSKYTRVYENGDRDFFQGFYAYRERAYDLKPLLGGILYTPFLDLTVHAFWKVQEIKTRKTKMIKS